jgi:phospholipid-binding lipoprotein MlaA
MKLSQKIRPILLVSVFSFSEIALALAESQSTSGLSRTNSQTDQSVPLEAETTDGADINDPLEPFNRVMYALNSVLDGMIMKPLAIAWRLLLPDPVREGVDHVFTNLKSPITLVNHALQGEPSRAATTLGRFLINTTMGILGIFDVATELGLPGEETTFNETLAVWGVNTGPYLIIPLLGPSSLRHIVGMGADYFFQPYDYYFDGDHHHGDSWVPWAIIGVEAIHKRNLVLESVDDVVANSADPYATFRSAYFQYQAYRIQKLKEH